MSTSDLWPLAREAWDALSAVYGPVMAHAASEAGLPKGSYFGWMLAAPGLEPGPISAARLAGRAPYTALALNESRLADGAELGLLRPSGEGEYALTDAGRKAARRIFEAARDSMVSLQPLPPADLDRLAGLLRRLVEASLAAPEPPDGRCLRLSRRIDPGEMAPVLVRIDQCLSDLNAYRDDSHMAVWQPYGISGAAWEAFSHLWRGDAGTLDDLYAKLAFRGHSREAYADAVQELIARRWVAGHEDGYRVTEAGQALRQQAEETTDRYFYAPWGCLDEGELGELRELLAGLRDGLRPAASD
jgi:DNA-binding PadR family transcriptional regulator